MPKLLMEVNELKFLFDAGQLKACSAVKYPLSDDWILQMGRTKGEPVLMDAQRVSPRRFKALVAAYKAAREIGFLKMEVQG